jgi:uncharacterized protein (DUF697 family)
MTEAETAVATAPPEDVNVKAHKLIIYCAWGSAGLGFVPIPLVDLIAIGGLQVWLIRELAKLYDVPFSGSRAKALVSALIGGGTPSILASGFIPLVKLVPVIGPLLGATVSPGLSGASTLAIGRVFVAHFKSGGTLLDFDADKMRSYYDAELASAKAEISKPAKSAPAAAAKA